MSRVPEDCRDVLAIAARWRAEGQAVALVTVIETWGSSPRPVGSILAVAGDGRFAGSVSGGCVEAATIEEAHAAIAAGRSRRVAYGETNGPGWATGLACGGRIELLIEPLPADDPAFDAILEALLADEPAILIRNVRAEPSSAPPVLLRPQASCAGDGRRQGGIPDTVREQALSLLQQERSCRLEMHGDELFFQVFAAPMRLIIVGAVEIGHALAQMAELAGYAVRFVEPRRAFAAREPFAAYVVDDDWPDAAVARLAADERTAVVALTHDPKLDDAALVEALRSAAFYVGCLGSRRTQAARLERLAALGVPPADLQRIHGPVGLAIGARTPAEIAVSILADLIRIRRAA